MNKNTKNRQRHFRNARRRGETSIVIPTPVPNYHSFSGARGSELSAKTFNVSVMKKDGVVSANPRRNMQQRVYRNQGDGLKGNNSQTYHEPIDASRPIQFPNHDYMKGAYRQVQL